MAVLLALLIVQFGQTYMEVSLQQEDTVYSRFVKMWIEEEECCRIIEQAWRSGCGRETIQDVMAIIEKVQ